ncbi:maltose/maltodextrin import ATP-binding protein MalK [Collimonas arenae]|uniref:Maltose/maltodextrin import ATP-binding protein MalK n=1 Tax=Collimonas arenae TaxID=279058 RepID=A0A127QN68_9BURK|nr:sn-glycerol-3-phosphate ABC transporter ATP-binding protein UgpC [Collimonas arenae]AMP01179.1 maltose/maltodextrin import ATP-binding protein MalK [Collimonas arenae]AMP11072.1 maltose/maltodextrin import ATP-binding protein MalK [Collimonas arenae]
MAGVKIRNLVKSYDDNEVMRDINLDIVDGEFVVFVGPSGCGKSTLLRMIAGLEDITSGDLFIGDTRMNDVPPAKRGIAMVFQSYALYPHMTLYDNMAFGLKIAGKSKAEIDAAVQKAAKTLHIDHLLDRKPKALSGGQRQRVAIGRAITREPSVFLFDEPLSNLDSALRVKMRLEFSRLHDQLKTTMIYVTHDQIEAMTLADKIVVLSAGRIEQIGSPQQLYHHPANRFVAGFIGSPKMNFIDGKVAGIAADGVLVELAHGGRQQVAVEAGSLKIGDAVSIGIRAEHLLLDQHAPILKAKFTVLEALGDFSYLYADSNASDEPLVLRVPDTVQVAHGSDIGVSADPQRCHLFDGDGRALRRLDTAGTAHTASARETARAAAA